MDVIVLPLLWPNTTVTEALNALQLYRRAGVVRQNLNDSYRLLFAGDLLRARAQGKTVIDQVEGGYDVVLVDPPTATTFNLDLVRPRRTELAYERMLDARRASYGLVGETSNEALVVTRHEGQTKVLSTTGGFECTGTPTHFFPEPEVAANTNCPLYPECSRADGTTPTIQAAY